jgi:hypothetical protein
MRALSRSRCGATKTLAPFFLLIVSLGLILRLLARLHFLSRSTINNPSVGVQSPVVLFLGFATRSHRPDRRLSRTEQSGCQPRKALCTEICAHAICRKFGGRTFLPQFFSMADVKKCRVNTGEKDGGPGRDRTDDLFHAMEARSQLRHRPTLGNTGGKC